MKEIIEVDVAAKQYLDRIMNEAANVPVDESSDFVIEKPSYYNEKLFRRGQDFYVKNRFAVFSGMMTGLIGLLAVPSILDILVGTNQSSTALTSFRRYMATVFHVLNWLRYKPEQGTNSWRSLEAVRKLHLYSSRRTQKMGIGFISQKDMALTQYAFFGFILLKWKNLGIQHTKEDFDAFCHFWRVIGYMLGIKDEYNLASDTFDETASRLEAVRLFVYRPYLTKPKDTFEQMSKAAIEGFWCFQPILNYDAYIYWTKYLSGLPGYEYFQSSGQKNIQILNWYSRYSLWMLVYVQQILLNYWIFRMHYNFQMLWSEALIRYFPFLAFYKFGIKQSYVRIF